MPYAVKSSPPAFSRKMFLELIKAHPDKLNLKSMSLALGRNPAYLHQFIHRGSPRILPEAVRYRLADMLDIDESLLRQNSTSAADTSSSAELNEGDGMPSLLSIGFLDHPSQNPEKNRPWLLPTSMLAQQRVSNVYSLRLAEVSDGNIDQRIKTGDVVMIDLSDTSPHRAGLFCVNGGDHIRIRHLEAPESKPPFKFLVSRDSTSNGYMVEGTQIDIIGRVIFHSRMIEGAR